MPVPDFSPGEVLTAGAMDSIAMWRVAGGPLSGTATNFVGCFTSNYTNYRVVVDSVAWNATGDLYYQLLTGSTPENGGNYHWAMAGFRANGVAFNSTAQSQTLGFLGATNSGANNLIVGAATWDILGPQLAQRTLLTGEGAGVFNEYMGVNGMNAHNLTNAYTGIRFLTNTATTFTGNVTIYGYRKP